MPHTDQLIRDEYNQEEQRRQEQMDPYLVQGLIDFAMGSGADASDARLSAGTWNELTGMPMNLGMSPEAAPLPGLEVPSAQALYRAGERQLSAAAPLPGLEVPSAQALYRAGERQLSAAAPLPGLEVPSAQALYRAGERQLSAAAPLPGLEAPPANVGSASPSAQSGIAAAAPAPSGPSEVITGRGQGAATGGQSSIGTANVGGGYVPINPATAAVPVQVRPSIYTPPSFPARPSFEELLKRAMESVNLQYEPQIAEIRRQAQEYGQVQKPMYLQDIENQFAGLPEQMTKRYEELKRKQLELANRRGVFFNPGTQLQTEQLDAAQLTALNQLNLRKQQAIENLNRREQFINQQADQRIAEIQARLPRLAQQLAQNMNDQAARDQIQQEMLKMKAAYEQANAEYQDEKNRIDAMKALADQWYNDQRLQIEMADKASLADYRNRMAGAAEVRASRAGEVDPALAAIRDLNLKILEGRVADATARRQAAQDAQALAAEVRDNQVRFGLSEEAAKHVTVANRDYGEDRAGQLSYLENVASRAAGLTPQDQQWIQDRILFLRRILAAQNMGFPVDDRDAFPSGNWFPTPAGGGLPTPPSYWFPTP